MGRVYAPGVVAAIDSGSIDGGVGQGATTMLERV
jgi:hypothetical protein